MVNYSMTPQAQTVADALLVIPLPDLDAAEQWKRELEDRLPGLHVVVTSGSEEVSMDPETGDVHVSLTFKGAWRAQFAGGGVVSMAQRQPTLTRGD